MINLGLSIDYDDEGLGEDAEFELLPILIEEVLGGRLVKASISSRMSDSPCFLAE